MLLLLQAPVSRIRYRRRATTLQVECVAEGRSVIVMRTHLFQRGRTQTEAMLPARRH